MCQIQSAYRWKVMYDTHMSEEEAAAFARCMVAVGYYTQNNVSIGYCAQIAGMTEEEFIKYLGKGKVSILSSLTIKQSFWRNWRMRRVICKFHPHHCTVDYWIIGYTEGSSMQRFVILRLCT